MSVGASICHLRTENRSTGTRYKGEIENRSREKNEDYDETEGPRRRVHHRRIKGSQNTKMRKHNTVEL